MTHNSLHGAAKRHEELESERYWPASGRPWLTRGDSEIARYLRRARESEAD
jgi:hypothetical protein